MTSVSGEVPGPAPAAPAGPGEDAVVDLVVAAVLAVPGVTGLHGGPFGIGTYLPGRRVAGVRLGPDGAEIHVTVAMGSSIPAVAAAIAAAVEPVARAPVRVAVEDVVPSKKEHAA